MKQLNIKINDDLAEAIYAKIKKEKCQIKTLVEGFFEKWLNEKGTIQDEKKLENRIEFLENTLLDKNILTRLEILEQAIKPLLNKEGILKVEKDTFDENQEDNTFNKKGISKVDKDTFDKNQENNTLINESILKVDKDTFDKNQENNILNKEDEKMVIVVDNEKLGINFESDLDTSDNEIITPAKKPIENIPDIGTEKTAKENYEFITPASEQKELFNSESISPLAEQTENNLQFDTGDNAPSITPLETEQSTIEQSLETELTPANEQSLETEFDPNETLEQHLDKLKGKTMSEDHPLANLNLGILAKHKNNFDFSIFDSDTGVTISKIAKLIPNDRADKLKKKPPEIISHLVSLVLGFPVRCEKTEIIQKSKPNKISITIFKI